MASSDLIGVLLIYSVVGFFGISFVMAMIRRFGCVIAVTVTSTRKALSIMLSFVLFPKPLSANYVVAFLVFSAGIVADVVVKNAAAKSAAKRLWEAFVAVVSGGGWAPLVV